MGVLFIYLGVTLVVSFLCSILESILLSTPLTYVTMREEDGSRGAVLFKKYKQETDKPLAAILSLNTIANTIGAAGVGQQAAVVFGSAWFGVVSGTMTLMILIFSEIIPKTIGTSYWKKLMSPAAYVIRGMVFVMYPIVLLINLISRLFAPKEVEKTVSREEVSAMVNVGEEEGVFEESETKIIQNLIKIDTIRAADAMTPRVVAAVASEKMSLKTFYKDNAFLHHSRIPVYSDSPEYISGYVLRSDALQLMADDKFDVKLSSIRRDISFFNENTSIGDIWEQFMANKEQISVIIDEYGCFQGILTLEDILETLLGQEIMDENDEVSDLQQFARERWEQRQKKLK